MKIIIHLITQKYINHFYQCYISKCTFDWHFTNQWVKKIIKLMVINLNKQCFTEDSFSLFISSPLHYTLQITLEKH